MSDPDRKWIVTLTLLAPQVCEAEHVAGGVKEAVSEQLDSFTVLDVEAVPAPQSAGNRIPQ